MIDLVWNSAWFLAGLLVGSTLNAAEYRLYHSMPFMNARSQCRECQHVLQARDLIPVLSFVALRGKCRQCDATISWQYPIVELLVAVMFTASAWLFGSEAEVIIANIYITVLVFLFLYDLKYMLIPDKVILPATLFAIVAQLAIGMDPTHMVLGGIIGGGVFLFQYVVSRGRWIGGGDIRLGLFMGIILGWQHVIVALLLAYILGAIFAVGLLVTGRAKAGTAIPFGTFLTMATVVALFAGQEIIDWYIGLLV